MKKILLGIAGLLLLSLPLTAQKKDFRGVRIFINPGHGGHDADDRHFEPTDFWESEGNLEKGLFLKKTLEDRKASVFISRTTNTTADDLDFGIIDEMANASISDVFLSIHSNGGNQKVNRPLVLFRGYDNQPLYPTSKALADTLWLKLFENGRNWTHRTPYVKGDWTFYPSWGKQGLGVLRNLAMPGILSEGSFHDYLPESRRMKNTDHLHHEAVAMYRAFESYFNIRPHEDGMLAGIVQELRPKGKGSKQTFEPGEPLNEVLVTLLPGKKTYRTDLQKNGFYCFDGLKPGNYTLIVEGPAGYASDTTQTVVTADRTTLQDIGLKPLGSNEVKK